VAGSHHQRKGPKDPKAAHFILLKGQESKYKEGGHKKRKSRRRVLQFDGDKAGGFLVHTERVAEGIIKVRGGKKSTKTLTPSSKRATIADGGGDRNWQSDDWTTLEKKAR